jgi:hypothetical protein
MKLKENFPENREIENRFYKLYEAHDVKMVGEWTNVDDSKEFYFMTEYRDEAHYNQFTEAMRENEDYQSASKLLEPIRESVEVVTLEGKLS